MRIIECEQRSPAWFSARLGKLTGSSVGEAFATRKDKGEAAGRRNARIRLVLERLTGKSVEDDYSNADMRRGVELEADAIGAYEAAAGILVMPVGFIEHDELMAGCSPDGLTVDGGAEVKCPKPAIHLDYLRGGLPNDYRLQCIHALWLTGRAWWDFVSYCPHFPPPLHLKITRIEAKDVDLAAHEREVRRFLEEVDRELMAVRTLSDLSGVLQEAV